MYTLASLSPQVLIHLFASLGALVIGPIALWARWRIHRPRLHRAFGYAWVTLMLISAGSAAFIHSHFPQWWRFSWIHLLIPVTLLGLFCAFWFLTQGQIAGHRKAMLSVYLGACLGAGVFTLLPGRFLGQFIWS